MAKKMPPPKKGGKGDKMPMRGKMPMKDGKCPECGGTMKDGKCTKCGYKAK